MWDGHAEEGNRPREGCDTARDDAGDDDDSDSDYNLADLDDFSEDDDE